MPPEEPMTQDSPSTGPCLERPESSFSTVSEAATFYSAHDIPSNQCTLNYEKQHSIEVMKVLKKRNKSQSSVIPSLSRQDSGYAAYSSDTPSSLMRSDTLRSKIKYANKKGSQPDNSKSTATKSDRAQLYLSHSYTPYYQQRDTPSKLSTYKNRPYHLYQQTYVTQHPPFSLSEWIINDTPSNEDFSGNNFHPPIPSTIHYWTSDDSRRLEYAAIDAASSGVRGFLVRLVPDCILPAQTRRTKFFRNDSKKRQREGSVRRYRLILPEELEEDKGKADYGINSNTWPREGDKKRPGLLRRLSTGLKSDRSVR